jgi:hypothetical protein
VKHADTHHMTIDLREKNLLLVIMIIKIREFFNGKNSTKILFYILVFK